MFLDKIFAELNALSLLSRFLSDYELLQLVFHNQLNIIGSEGNIYRIENGDLGVHSHLVDGFGKKSTEWWCVMQKLDDSSSEIPFMDEMLTQKLWLEAEEDDYMNNAHYHKR